MFFLVRACFWICVVALVLPTGAHDGVPLDQAAQRPLPSISSVAAGAVERAVAYCSAEPASCRKGSEAAQALGSKIDEGARLVTAYLAQAQIPLPPRRPAFEKPKGPGEKENPEGPILR